jgi:hypothetical protein
MTQEQKLIFDALDELGGEPLEGSGFETETFETEFNETNAEAAERRS